MSFFRLFALLLLLSTNGTNAAMAFNFVKQTQVGNEMGTLITSKDNTNHEEKEKEKAGQLRKKMYQDDKKYLDKYADSLLHAALQSKDNALIGDAYLTKGIVHFNQKEMQKALDHYLIANDYISRTNNPYAIHKAKYALAHIKYYLGFYDEAISLFKECIKYYSTEDDRAYLNSIHSIGLCYTKIGKFNLCSYYNALGLKEAKLLENHSMDAYFIHSEGVNNYFKKKYKTAIKQLHDVLPVLIKRNDFANETVAYFYTAKSLTALSQQEQALPYLIKVENAFEKHNYIRPDLRENYEMLIDYYKKKGNKEQQLTFIDKLLQVDQVLNENYKYLSRKIVKEYDTKNLLNAKTALENKMRWHSLIAFLLITFMGALIAFLIHKHYKNKRLFNELMQQKKSPEKTILSEVTLDINQELADAIVLNLEKFEEKKRYLEKDMTLNKLALYLKTNPKYASKIILKYRGKKSIEYISDLKIDHVIELLKTQNKYRNYTNKALAEEVGFGSTQNFTRAFKNKTDLSPTYFIQELIKSFPLH